jgi:3-oxoacyl-[acyl-carrier protein] reductase
MSDPPVVLITGSRKGIGRHLVHHFIGQGALVEGCSRLGFDGSVCGYTHHRVDVTEEEAVKEMILSIAERHGRLDATVNNAGVGSMNHVLLTPVRTVRQLMETNVLGTFLVSRESAKLMCRRRSGRIVSLSSVALPLRLEGQAAYVASRGAIVALAQVMARELAEFGITSNVVELPPIETDAIRSVPRDKIDGIVARLPIKRLGTFEDVANAVDFFLRPESDFVTGQVISLGGLC